MTDTTSSKEAVYLTYQHEGRTYEIDHLDITTEGDYNYGVFAVYRNDVMLSDFTPYPFQPKNKPLPTDDELIRMAIESVKESEVEDV